MADLNVVYLLGNLTRDPEVKYIPSGEAVADLQLAVNRRFKTRDGQDKEETCFVGVDVWGRTAENCAKFLRKGSPVLIEGRLKYHQWEKDGQKQSRLRVQATRVQFLSMGGRGGDAARAAGEAAPPAPAPAARRPESPAVEADEPPPPEAPPVDADNLPF